MLKKIVVLCVVALVSLSANSFDRNMYLTGQIKVKGESGPNQNRYSAIRSAQLIAQRNLLEVIGGLQLTASSTLRDGILQDDTIMTQVQGYLKGATVLEEHYNPQDGSASVVLGIGYIGSMSNVLAKSQETGVLERVLYKTQKPVYYKVVEKKEQVQEKVVEQVQEKVEAPVEKKKESVVANTPAPQKSYDSLIVDVRELAFEPAQVNRIYVDTQLVYDPLMVPAEIIAQRGLAKYTTTLNRAKAILESYNAMNPLVVKASKTAKLASDVLVNEEQAEKITLNNTNKGFLESAKIVFIVK